ncbi:DNA polymerase III subunit gamma/tau [Paenibacillus pedocola]|uniref:DNA polymerase III subunit gamma/tau n=1 Tax=Paenibacillus pedocola TaxID=3242193 RepID=UPI002877778F|nr:DNA polymerase III subunit gamma/tau [Paenibacillus typhae]
MFNKDLREEAVGNLREEQSRYESENKRLAEDAERLLDKRRVLKSIVDESWEFIHNLRNKPAALDTDLKVIKIESKKFSGLLYPLEKEIAKANIASGGTAAGMALPGLAGPVGRASSGGAILTAGLLNSRKNRKIAEQASTEAAAIRTHLRAIEATRKEIQEITALSVSTSEGLRRMLLKCRTFTTDYAELPPETKQRLGAMVNHAKAGAQLLNRAVGANA